MPHAATTEPAEKSPAPQKAPQKTLAAAAAYGVDLSQLRERLRLSPTERLRQHQHFLKFVLDVRKAGTALRS